LGRIFLEDFFGRIFLGGIFWEKNVGRIFLGGFFGRNSLGGTHCYKSASYLNYLNLKGIDAFVKILSQCKEEGRKENLDP
jgi:hypothetical protein